MPFLFDNSYTYSGDDSADLVLRPATERPALSTHFTIVEGLKGKKIVHSLNRINKVTKKDPGCGQGKSSITLPTDAAMWNPQDLKVWIAECWSTLRGKILEWKLKTLNDKSDLTGTDIEMYLLDAVTDAAYTDLLRIGWFGDMGITSSQLTNAGDVVNYNQFPGIWKRTFDAVTAGKIRYTPIDDNAETTAAGQDLEPGDAFPVFQKLFNSAPSRLKALGVNDKQFKVTNTLFTNYLNYRESQNLDTSFTMQGNGETNLSYRGQPITVVNEWDEFITADFYKNGKYDLPHRAMLVGNGVLQLGFDAVPFNAQGENPFEIWYEKADEEWNARLKYMADSQIADTNLIAVSY